MTDTPVPMNPLAAAIQREIADIERVDWTAEDTKRALERPRDFGLSSSAPHAAEMFETWALGPVIEHRDSGILARSNARVLRRELERAERDGVIEPDSYEEISANHWAVGHVDHLTYRVLDDEGHPTRVARWLKAWFAAIGPEGYPVADDSDHSALEYEETCENIRCVGGDVERRSDEDEETIELPDGWEGEVFSWFWDNDQGAVENRDDRGGCPTEAQIRKAWTALGYLKRKTEAAS